MDTISTDTYVRGELVAITSHLMVNNHRKTKEYFGVIVRSIPHPDYPINHALSAIPDQIYDVYAPDLNQRSSVACHATALAFQRRTYSVHKRFIRKL